MTDLSHQVSILISQGESGRIPRKETAERIMELLAAWQPIETAPKEDGCYVLVYGPEGVDMSTWEPHWGDDGKWRRMLTAEYDNDGASIAPTHWMPLPAPPTA